MKYFNTKSLLPGLFTAFLFLLLPDANSQTVSKWDQFPASVKNRNSFKRLEWFYKPRMNEQGIFPRSFVDLQKEAELLKMQSQTDNGNSSFQWTNLGPAGIDFSNDSTVKHWGVMSGRVKGLAIHPTNPNIVYAGPGGGGIWKSTDGGQTWIDKSGGLNLLTFGSIAIDPANPEVIYAGTGEYFWLLSERFYCGDGVYKSTNGGESWDKINAEFGTVTQFTAMAVSPHNPNIIIAAIARNLEDAAPNEGIWRSTDAGIHWSCVLPGEGMCYLAFHSSDPNIVYVACGSEQPQAGFLISTDGGLSFSSGNVGLPAYNHIGRIQFDVSKSNPNILYAAIFDKAPLPGGIINLAGSRIWWEEGFLCPKKTC
jgi:hypothetical protein